MSFDTPLPPYNAADPHATFLNASCLDLLLIELVPMAGRLGREMSRRVGRGRGDWEDDVEDVDIDGEGKGEGGGRGGKSVVPAKGDVEVEGDVIEDLDVDIEADGRTIDEDEEREALFLRLEGWGYRVGLGLVERFSRDRPRFTDTLDVIKFICKDLWTLVFRKQIDNLKTNHRGVYVLTDNAFRPFARMSTEVGGQAVVRAQPFLFFPCGVIRGALAGLGVTASVQAETAELPGATFQIKTTGVVGGEGR
ncbi:MAG: Trafficking protein particle complex subunit 33 [Caeruleum heppii]|nr:MAG: Trafficking protein particle complex subunit 33 [Caeruleum heppii]